ncbi:MAG: CoA-binding protein [Planctomycetota bacterium]
MRVMVIGASRDRSKYGNKAVRAYLRHGHEVFPINPSAGEIEGVPALAPVVDPPGPIDRATVYLPPHVTLGVLQKLASRGDVSELWLNPGSESREVLEEAQRLGLEPIVACSIVAIGERP